jgi:glycolate oxidase
MRGEFSTNEEIIQAAYRRLAQGSWDSLSGGTESETSLRRNRLAFDRLALRPRVLVDSLPWTVPRPSWGIGG